VEHQHGPLIRGESPETALELVAVRDEAGLIADDRRRDGRELDFHRPPPPASGEIKTCIDRQPMHPGAEPVRVP